MRRRAGALVPTVHNRMVVSPVFCICHAASPVVAHCPCTCPRFQGHNRYWSNETTYAKQNGGQFEFLIDNQSGDNGHGHGAVPVQQEFWDYLMATSKQWGLEVYEQVCAW